MRQHYEIFVARSRVTFATSQFLRKKLYSFCYWLLGSPIFPVEPTCDIYLSEVRYELPNHSCSSIPLCTKAFTEFWLLGLVESNLLSFLIRLTITFSKSIPLPLYRVSWRLILIFVVLKFSSFFSTYNLYRSPIINLLMPGLYVT